MSPSALFDGITKFVAAAGALAAIYAAITKNAHEVGPVVLTVAGLAYEALLGVAGLVIAVVELRYWNGPVYRRGSHTYRVMLTRPPRQRAPTNWEIADRARRRDQVLTVLFGLGGAAFLGPLMFSAIRDDLRGGFPVDRWSLTWFSGLLALAATGYFGLRTLLSWYSGDRVSRRKQRCPSCGELAARQARVCPHCKEWFPAWKVLSPTASPHDHSPRGGG